MEQYKIIPKHGHYEVYDSKGNFFCSADNYKETEKEIEEG